MESRVGGVELQAEDEKQRGGKETWLVPTSVILQASQTPSAQRSACHPVARSPPTSAQSSTLCELLVRRDVRVLLTAVLV